MNLAALANLVCLRSGQVQTKDQVACKGFLTFRHDQLYRSKLWKDSIIEYQLAIDPNAAYFQTSPYLPKAGVVLLPTIFQHVIAARTSEHKLDIQRPMLYYRVDQDQFAKTGIPLDYALLSACVWQLDAGTGFYLLLTAANAADNQSTITLDLVQQQLPGGGSFIGDDVSISRYQQNPSASNWFVATDRIDSVTKPVTQGSITVYCGPSTVQVLNTTNNGVNLTATYSDNSQAALLIPAGLALGFLPVANNGVTLVSITDGVNTLNIAPANTGLLRGGTVTYNGNFTGAIGNPAILTLQTGDTEAPRRQRIRLLDIPSAATTLRILGKRTVPPFSADSDIPGVDGMETVLMSMAYYDMLHRDERGGSKEASDALEEAAGLLKQLEAEEVFQGASNSRILPETGFGPDEYYIGPIF